MNVKETAKPKVVCMFLGRSVLGALFIVAYTCVSTTHAYSCSLVDVQASIANSVVESGHYLIASAGILGLMAFWDIYKRYLSYSFVIASALLTLHPYWTVSPGYMPDCTFLNILASQIVFGVMLLLLLYKMLVYYFLSSRQK
jgi:hypothetical protein